jgi:hypothetical protein
MANSCFSRLFYISVSLLRGVPWEELLCFEKLFISAVFDSMMAWYFLTSP